MAAESPAAQTWIEARVTETGVWMLVTRSGGDDPQGDGGTVLPGAGSGCRWIEYEPSDPAASVRRFHEAQAFHREASRV